MNKVWARAAWSIAVMLASAGLSGVMRADAPATAPTTASASQAAGPKKNLPLVAVARIVTGDNNEATRDAVEKLSTVYSVMEAKDKTLRQVTDNMRGAWGINLAINWADLKQEGIGQDTLITYRLLGVSGAQTLESVLALAAPGKLQYAVNDGVVEIGTRARAAKLDVPRVYDPELLAKKQFHIETGVEDTAVKERVGTKHRAEKLAEVLRALADSTMMSAKTTVVDFLAGKVGVRGPAELHWDLSGIYDDMRHPIHVPVAASECAAEMKATGEPLKLPPRLRATTALRTAQKQLVAPMDLEAPGRPLEAVLTWLQKGTGLNMVLDWRGLAEAGIKPETQISIKEAKAPVEQAIKDVLAAAATASAPAAKEPIGMTVSAEGVITISAQKYLPTEETTAVFEVRDVIKRGIYLAPPNKKPTTQELAAAIMEGLSKAGEDEAWGKRVKMVEYEGLIAVRGTPADIRVIGRHLAALAK